MWRVTRANRQAMAGQGGSWLALTSKGCTSLLGRP